MCSERKVYVDYIKAIGIILTIIGHVNFALDAPMKAWIYSFHMPVFFFATGLTLKTDTPCMQYISKKARSLLIPYFLWALIFSEFSFRNLAKITYASYATINSAGSLSSLWFLPAMFAALFIIYLMNRLTSRKPVVVLLSILSFVLAILLPEVKYGYPICIDAAMTAVLFISTGMFGETLIDRICSQWLCLLLAMAGFALTLLYRCNPVNAESYVLIAQNRIGDPCLFLAAAIGGCILVCFLAKLLAAVLKHSRFLSFVGQNTLVIFAVQKPIISLFEKLFGVIRLNRIAALVISSLGTLLLSCLIAMMINRIVPWLAGKQYAAKENTGTLLIRS